MDSNSQSPNQLKINPDATSAELDRLAQIENETEKKAVILHPNTSPETLIKLLGEYDDLSGSMNDSERILEYVLNSPNLPFILLEQPDFLDRLCQQPYCYYNMAANLPQFFIDWAVNHVDASIRSGIANNDYIPISCLIELARDKDRNVRESVASNVCMSDEAFKWVYSDEVMKRTVKHYPDAVDRIICQLAKDPEIEVRRIVAYSIRTPTYILEQLSFDSELDILCEVASNRKTPEIILKRFSKHQSQSIIEALAKNKNLPVDLIEMCASSDNIHVRYFIADNGNTPITILSKLADDKERMIRQVVANNFNTPPHIIEHLAIEGIKEGDFPF